MVRGERPGGRVGGRHRQHHHQESHPPYRPLLVRLPEAIREALPADLQGFRVRFGAGLVKLFYGHPSVHFEVWFHTRTQRIE
ncbi:MAG: hypothetical protein HYX89_02795, partial [Chloroflexi bacterium]|nr:hypothetical protein [Chloroflexota bacterium]